MTFGQRPDGDRNDTLDKASKPALSQIWSGALERVGPAINRLKGNLSGLPGIGVPELATEGPPISGDTQVPPVDVRKTVRTGYLIVIAFFGVLGGWAAFAPLESAAVAPGFVGVESKRKTIQHLEGGIIGHIYVKDGAVVGEGDVLIQLDDTQPKANLELLRGNYLSLTALEARLVSERDGRSTIKFPEAMSSRQSESEIAEILEGQNNIFETRKEAFAARIAILEQGIAQYNEEIKGLASQIVSETRQLELLDDELQGVRILLDTFADSCVIADREIRTLLTIGTLVSAFVVPQISAPVPIRIIGYPTICADGTRQWDRYDKMFGRRINDVGSGLGRHGCRVKREGDRQDQCNPGRGVSI